MPIRSVYFRSLQKFEGKQTDTFPQLHKPCSRIEEAVSIEAAKVIELVHTMNHR